MCCVSRTERAWCESTYLPHIYRMGRFSTGSTGHTVPRLSHATNEIGCGTLVVLTCIASDQCVVESKYAHHRTWGEPTLVTLTVQNTGTGHNVPTGAPFKVVHIEMDLLYERRSNDWRTSGTPFKETLARTVTTTPPYDTVEDTSLLPGETRQWTWPISLPITASAGPWEIRVRVYKSSAKNIREDLFENRFPVRVH